jgi:hypothetical protein
MKTLQDWMLYAIAVAVAMAELVLCYAFGLTVMRAVARLGGIKGIALSILSRVMRYINDR